MAVMASPWLFPAACAFYPGKPGYELAADYRFLDATGKEHTIPAGFWFNGASIPTLFQRMTYTPFDPRIIPAALPHDYFYTAKPVSREVADATLAMYLRKNTEENSAWRGKLGMVGRLDIKRRNEMVITAVELFGAASWKDSVDDKAYLYGLRAIVKSRGGNLMKYGL